MSLRVWGAKWWQWASAASDKGKPHCGSSGQELPGRTEGNSLVSGRELRNRSRYAHLYHHHRQIHLFFPLINTIYTWEKADQPCPQARPLADSMIDDATALFVTLDDVALADPMSYRATSPSCFDPQGTDASSLSGGSAISDGILGDDRTPAEAHGEHTLHLGGRSLDSTRTSHIPADRGMKGSSMQTPFSSRAVQTSLPVFLLVWLGQLISLLGSGLTEFALGVWVYQRTGSMMQFALTFLFLALPRVLLSPFAGALIDRWDRRWTMLLSDLGAGCTTILIVPAVLERRAGDLAHPPVYDAGLAVQHVSAAGVCSLDHPPGSRRALRAGEWYGPGRAGHRKPDRANARRSAAGLAWAWIHLPDRYYHVSLCRNHTANRALPSYANTGYHPGQPALGASGDARRAALHREAARAARANVDVCSL